MDGTREIAATLARVRRTCALAEASCAALRAEQAAYRACVDVMLAKIAASAPAPLPFGKKRVRPPGVEPGLLG